MSESTTKAAVVTAIITGVFTVVAGVATYWLTTKEPELAYSIVGGPTLATAAGSKRIFVVEVRNSGRKEIAQTLVRLGLQGGHLSEIASEASPGVRLTEEKSEARVEIYADLLNPGDLVKVSFLTSLATPGAMPDVIVRAPGVKGTAITSKDSSLFAGISINTLFALFGVVFAAMLSSVLSRTPIGRKLGILQGNGMDQAEVVSFVCGTCGLFDEADQLRFTSGNITYRGAADYLRQRAQRATMQDRKKYLAALHGLLLVRKLADESATAIRASIGEVAGQGLLDAQFQDLRRQAADEAYDPVVWRSQVKKYVETMLQRN